jgi:hypothetical protein
MVEKEHHIVRQTLLHQRSRLPYVDEHDHHTRGVDNAATGRRARAPLRAANIQRNTHSTGTRTDLHHIAGRRVLHQRAAAQQYGPCRDDALRGLRNRRRRGTEQCRKRQAPANHGTCHEFVPRLSSWQQGTAPARQGLHAT